MSDTNLTAILYKKGDIRLVIFVCYCMTVFIYYGKAGKVNGIIEGSAYLPLYIQYCRAFFARSYIEFLLLSGILNISITFSLDHNRKTLLIIMSQQN